VSRHVDDSLIQLNDVSVRNHPNVGDENLLFRRESLQDVDKNGTADTDIETGPTAFDVSAEIHSESRMLMPKTQN